MTVAWILLFDAAYQLMYSFVNIPYGSLSAAMTQDPVDRSKLSGARSIAAGVGGVSCATTGRRRRRRGGQAAPPPLRRRAQ